MKVRNQIKLTAIIMSCLLILVSCSEKPIFEGEYEWELQEFSAVNQDNEKVSRDDLIGEAWLANFVFTQCTTVCQPMTANMAKLQQKLNEEKVKFNIISFSVDPERDKPEILKEYGDRYEADYSTWNFLTGYSEDEIKMIAKNFKTLAEREEGTDQFIHSTKIFLINGEGKIVKGYNGIDVPYDEIINDMKSLNKALF
ncbi:protein SCO1/2 [Cytobacillus eiseniae]|uniref:Protein SCO1/2 n=1 Tax=Cytobacillus eiseniae TaxID=762947 RepID=A0ABS4RLZ5_9BACI|nr:SCO family protein [Cytobacillus eiseniae]MBP2243375.1 protein SCO1/2 [Cytobacillus eiseniae]